MATNALSITGVTPSKHCEETYVWAVSNRTLLVELMALLILGQHTRATRVIRTLTASTIPNNYASDSALGLLESPNTDHRDGWLFQLIAWIAEAQQSDPKDILRAPHCRPIDHGFDGLSVRLGAPPKGVVIYEQKATAHSRKKIRTEVFPEFSRVDLGERDAELVSDLFTLVSQLEDPETFVQIYLHDSPKQYSAAVTLVPKTRKNTLFKGYRESVKGASRRRCGSYILMPDLRPWFDKLAIEIAAKIRSL